MTLELWQLELKYADLRIADPHRQARLVALLVEHGQQQPVLVVRAGGEAPSGIERYVLIDGYVRMGALRELGRDTVEAMVLGLPEADALVLAFRLEHNRVRSIVEQAWLLRELLAGKTQRELAALMGRSESWVSRRLALVGALSPAIESAVRRGVIPAQAAMKYLVPLARAKADSEQLVRGIGAKRLSVRQMAILYAGWRAGNQEQRERLIREPLLYLQMEEKMASADPAPAADPGAEREQALLRDLGALAGICRRARQAVRERTKQDKDVPWPTVFRYAWQEAQASFGALVAVITEVTTDA